jgi:hypothetical protein
VERLKRKVAEQSFEEKAPEEENAKEDRARTTMSPFISDSQFVDFYVHGFRRALLRYRLFVIIGWAVTALGAFGLFGSCQGIDRGDLLVIAIPVVTMAAGIIAVHVSITALESYVTTPFPLPDEGEIEEGVRKKVVACEELMNDVETGGWKEAFEAIGKLEALERKS